MAGSLVKGLIGKEDCDIQGDELYPSTFSRTSSVGGAVNLRSFPDLWMTHQSAINAKYYGAHDATRATLNAAVTSQGTSTVKCIYLEPGTWDIGDDLDFSSYSNIFFYFCPGAILSVSTGKALILPCRANIIAGIGQRIFSGAGTVTFVSDDGISSLAWDGTGTNELGINVAPGASIDLKVPTLALGSGATAASILDEDDMTSDSATALATQQSIKAYVDGLALAHPRSYLAGLGLSNAPDSEHDVTLATGETKDSSNAYMLKLTSSMTKQIDASWAAGTNAGGLFAGTVGNLTWYHVFLIRKDSDGTIDAGFDTSVTAANIPAGYTKYRRIGSVLSDGSANILAFFQRGDQFLWKDPPLDINITNSNYGASAILRTLSVPLGVQTKALVIVSSTDQPAAQAHYFSCPDVNDEVPGVTTNLLCQLYPGTDPIAQIEILTNTSSQIRSRVSATDATSDLYIRTLGWTDTRGKDD